MDQETEKIITAQFEKLPENVKMAIVSAEYQTKLQEITKRQKLLINQAAKLAMETTLVMIGLEPLADYVANLQREMDIPLVRAKEISLDVSENIFKPIRESLYAMNGLREEEETAEEKIAKTDEGTDIDLDRDQILSEIEDPSLIGRSEINSFTPTTAVTTGTTSREIETLDEVPYQQDIKIKAESPVAKASLLETKMGDMVISSQQIVDAKPEIKLPPIEKRRPSSGVDPYREEII